MKRRRKKEEDGIYQTRENRIDRFPPDAAPGKQRRKQWAVRKWWSWWDRNWCKEWRFTWQRRIEEEKMESGTGRRKKEARESTPDVTRIEVRNSEWRMVERIRERGSMASSSSDLKSSSSSSGVVGWFQELEDEDVRTHNKSDRIRIRRTASSADDHHHSESSYTSEGENRRNSKKIKENGERGRERGTHKRHIQWVEEKFQLS